MRICFVTLDFAPFRSSGLTVYAESLVCGLAKRGHQVTVIAADRREGIQVDVIPMPENIQVVRVPVGAFDWIGLGWQAARYLQSSDNFEIIHFADIHFAYAHYGQFIASAHQSFRQRLTSHQGRPYHSTWRDYLFRLIYYNGARWIIEQPTVRRATFIVMISAATQQEFIKHYQVDPARTMVIYHGLELSRFEALPERSKARQRLGLPLDMPILLYIGFSTPRKGVEYLAQALTYMKTPAYLIIVGKWEPHYRKRFLSTLSDAILSRTRLVGYVPDADLPVYYAAADVFVLPTLLEGFGIPLAEAMAAGLPVVTTQGGAASEVVGDAGLVVPSGDSVALACALDCVLTDSNLAQRLRCAGRDRARAMFDERRTMDELEAVYYRFRNQL